MAMLYSDADTFRLVESVAAISKLKLDDVWEMYGRFLYTYVTEIGYDQLMKCMSPNLKGFLDNLDSLHYFVENVVYKGSKIQGPSFRCETNNDGSLTLHYYSSRSGLFPIVKGVVQEVAKEVFKVDIKMSISGRNQRVIHMASGEKLEEHVVFVIKTLSSEKEPSGVDQSPSLCVPGARAIPAALKGPDDYMGKLRVTAGAFARACPFHLVIDEDCRIVSFGALLPKYVPIEMLASQPHLVRLFELIRPQIPLDYENIISFINAIFVLRVRPITAAAAATSKPTSGAESSTASSVASLRSATAIDNTDASRRGSTVSAQGHLTTELSLKGQMTMLDSGKHLLFICSPNVTNVPELLSANLRIGNIPLHDCTRDLILLNQHRLKEVAISEKLEEASANLEKMHEEVKVENAKAEALLREVLPEKVAAQLMEGKSVDACEFNEATVLFSDVPNFQKIIPDANPKEIVVMLNDLFTRIDRLVDKHDVYKVETIADSYMVVSGAPEDRKDHAEALASVALGMIWEARAVPDPITSHPIQIRIGMNTGPIVCGVVGTKMPRYCLFGDTVNTASRMESHGQPGRIHCTQTARDAALRTGRFVFADRGVMEIKGKGPMQTYFLLSSKKKSLWELIGRERDESVHSIAGYEELAAAAEDDDDGWKSQGKTSDAAPPSVILGADANSRVCAIV